jgi:hypothetical protein
MSRVVYKGQSDENHRVVFLMKGENLKMIQGMAEEITTD